MWRAGCFSSCYRGARQAAHTRSTRGVRCSLDCLLDRKPGLHGHVRRCSRLSLITTVPRRYLGGGGGSLFPGSRKVKCLMRTCCWCIKHLWETVYKWNRHTVSRGNYVTLRTRILCFLLTLHRSDFTTPATSTSSCPISEGQNMQCSILI